MKKKKGFSEKGFLKKKKGGKRGTLDETYPRKEEEKDIGAGKHKNRAIMQEDKQS